jgi:hypothetical protein
LRVEISYNGVGRLIGRWEVVLPGDEPPSEQDLLTEASLPVEYRAQQRRYAQLSRFNVFLPPMGKFVLPGPDTSRLPTVVEGQYQVLLRVEVSDDPDGGSNLAAVNAGAGFIQSGAVAGFPLPPLRYYVGSKAVGAVGTTTPAISLTLPANEATVASDQAIDFTWQEASQAAAYRLELENNGGQRLLAAMLRRGVTVYRAPPWLKDKAGDGILKWRVVVFDQNGKAIGESTWRVMKLAPKSQTTNR